MLKKFLYLTLTKYQCSRCNFSQLARIVQTNPEIRDEIVSNESKINETKNSVLEPLSEDISHISTYLKPTFNFAAYADKSETLQELVKLGVNLHVIEKKMVDCIPYILRLKFEDIRDHIIFLTELGCKNKDIAFIVTKNPLIFKESLENLEVRINYLKFKKFTDEAILRLVTNSPGWLSYSTQEIDEKLGFFQRSFKLTGYEVRKLAEKLPKLITYSQSKVKLNMFVLKEEMGFCNSDLKKIILKRPKLFINDQNRLLKTFEYLHNTIGIPLDRIVETPEVLGCRENRLRDRHQFLVKLGRDQFDPQKPNYVALTTLVSGTDAEFATEVAKSSIADYNMYLKSM